MTDNVYMYVTKERIEHVARRMCKASFRDPDKITITYEEPVYDNWCSFFLKKKEPVRIESFGWEVFAPAASKLLYEQYALQGLKLNDE